MGSVLWCQGFLVILKQKIAYHVGYPTVVSLMAQGVAYATAVSPLVAGGGGGLSYLCLHNLCRHHRCRQ